MLGAPVIAFAVTVRNAFDPPIWVNMVLWTPVIIGGGILMLWPPKDFFIAMEYCLHLLDSLDRSRV